MVPVRLPQATQEALQHFEVGLALLREAVAMIAVLTSTEALQGRGYIKAAEAARISGLSSRWFYEHASELPFATRKGRRVLFEEAGLRRWLSSR